MNKTRKPTAEEVSESAIQAEMNRQGDDWEIARKRLQSGNPVTRAAAFRSFAELAEMIKVPDRESPREVYNRDFVLVNGVRVMVLEHRGSTRLEIPVGMVLEIPIDKFSITQGLGEISLTRLT